MSDITRWLADDITACEASIASHEEWAAHYEVQAELVAFDAEAQSYMLGWAARKRQAADEARERLTELKRRLDTA